MHAQPEPCERVVSLGRSSITPPLSPWPAGQREYPTLSGNGKTGRRQALTSFITCNSIAVAMTHHATQKMEHLGYRLTPQRTMVWDVLRENCEHLGAEEICLRVQSSFPHVNISTVYRTLELLVELELVRETHLGPDRRYYEVEEGEPHHHLVCTDCGRVIHVEHQDTASFRERIDREKRFTLWEVSAFGLCADCATGEDQAGRKPLDRK